MAFDVIHFEPAKGAASSAMEEEEERTSEKTVNADPARAREPETSVGPDGVGEAPQRAHEQHPGV